MLLQMVNTELWAIVSTTWIELSYSTQLPSILKFILIIFNIWTRPFIQFKQV